MTTRKAQTIKIKFGSDFYKLTVSADDQWLSIQRNLEKPLRFYRPSNPYAALVFDGEAWDYDRLQAVIHMHRENRQ